MLLGTVRLGTVLVRGVSMLPTLQDSDCLLVRRGGPVRDGDVVVGELDGRPGLRVVKRVRPLPGEHDSRWLLLSDAPDAPGAVSGPGTVESVVLLRWWPLPPRRVRRRR